MATQRDPRRRDVPPEVRAQIGMNLAMLDAADAFHLALPPEVRARAAAMSDQEAHEQFVAALALMSQETRDHLRRCVVWLRDLLDEISPPPDAPPHPGGPGRS